MLDSKIEPSAQEDINYKINMLNTGYQSWNSVLVQKRVKQIKKLRRVISKRLLEIAKTISDECFRPLTESLTQEVLPVLEMARYCEKNYPRWLVSKKFRYLRPGFSRKKNYLVRQPLGTVCVITPANFPFTLGLMSLIYIVLAGNTVVLKPSENSRAVAPLIAEILKEADLSPKIANIVFGGADAGKILIEHPQIKKIFFFGRYATGKAILEKCAHLFKPCVLELSGGSTAIVGPDADVELAASGIAWSGFYANGKSCIGTDRVFVDKKIAPEFINQLMKKVENFQNEQLTLNKRTAAFNHFEISQLKQMIDDANKQGCNVLCGGNIVAADEGRYDLEHTIITTDNPNATILTEELFAPLIAVCVVENLQKIVFEINNSYPSLGVSFWMKDKKQALNLAKKIKASMIWVNDTSFGLPCLPWFGAGKTGWGKLFSEHSLDEVSDIKWISCHPSTFAKKRLWWNPYSLWKEKLFAFAAKGMLRLPPTSSD